MGISVHSSFFSLLFLSWQKYNQKKRLSIVFELFSYFIFNQLFMIDFLLFSENILTINSKEIVTLSLILPITCRKCDHCQELKSSEK